jgi:hypothetical protein
LAAQRDYPIPQRHVGRVQVCPNRRCIAFGCDILVNCVEDLGSDVLSGIAPDAALFERTRQGQPICHPSSLTCIRPNQLAVIK